MGGQWPTVVASFLNAAVWILLLLMDGAVWMLSRAGAPRKTILRLPLQFPDFHHAATIVAQGDNAIEAFTPTESRLYVTEMVGGPITS